MTAVMNRIKLLVFLHVVIQILCISCATLDVAEIRDLHRTAFDSLELKPGYEINNLRIDLIRQNSSENINDTISETKDTPYHPFGFDLGNGLFYDINENLCLKLEFMLGYSADTNFEIHEVYRANKKRGINIYRFCNDTFKVNYLYGKNLHYRYHRVSNENDMTVIRNKRIKYSIAFTDSSAVYRENPGQPRIINRSDQDHYVLNTRKRKETFQKTGSELFLKNDYAVSLSIDKLALEIKNPRRKKNNTLYTLAKSYNQLFIYNKRYSGLKIETNGDSILVYRNKSLWTKYEITNRETVITKK